MRHVADVETTDLAAVEAYFAGLTEPARSTLETVRATLRTCLPGAAEGFAYGVPAFKVDNKGVAGYAGGASFCSYYPMSGRVLTALAEPLAGYERTSGALHFALDKPLSARLIKLLVKTRLAELSEVYNGPRTVYFDNGLVQARGRMRNGQLHGAWEWFRKDGTLLRTGEFINGSQVGRWTSYNAAGEPVRTKNFTA